MEKWGLVYARQGPRGRDQCGIDGGALPHRHATSTEVSLDGLKDLLPQLVIFHQVAEGQDRRFIRDPDRVPLRGVKPEARMSWSEGEQGRVTGCHSGGVDAPR